jgi:hypothetical protein
MGRTFNLWDRREFKEVMEFGMINYCSKVVEPPLSWRP